MVARRVEEGSRLAGWDITALHLSPLRRAAVMVTAVYIKPVKSEGSGMTVVYGPDIDALTAWGVEHLRPSSRTFYPGDIAECLALYGETIIDRHASTLGHLIKLIHSESPHKWRQSTIEQLSQLPRKRVKSTAGPA